MLYVTTGDGTSNSDEWDSGQDLTRLLAKMLNRDGGQRDYQDRRYDGY